MPALRERVRIGEDLRDLRGRGAGSGHEGEIDGQHDFALDEQIGIEHERVLRGVHGSLDRVLDGDERVVDLAVLGGAKHLTERAHGHGDGTGEIGLTAQCLLREGSDGTEERDGSAFPVGVGVGLFGRGGHDQRG